LLQSATAGGIMIGPAIGGILADMIGYREIFFITAATCFIGGFIIIKLVREVPQPQVTTSPPSVFENYRFLLRDPNLRIVGFTIVLSQIASLMVEPIFALFIESFTTNTKYLATLTGTTFTIAGVFMVFSAPWWGRRNDRLGFRQNLLIALIGTGIAYALHTIVPNLILLTILRAALGFAAGGILHALYSMTSLNVPEERKSGMIGIASSLAILGNMIGPLLGGMVAGQFGLTTTFVANSAIYFIAAGLIWKFYKRGINEQ
jgi:MFS transporter, DHA1 family, multidrug resistance protein